MARVVPQLLDFDVKEDFDMRNTSVTKIFGCRDAAGESWYLDKFAQSFASQSDYSAGAKNERALGARERRVVVLADQLTDDLRLRHGLEPFSVPLRNFHFFSKRAAPKMNCKGCYNFFKQGVTIGRVHGLYHLFGMALHELIHFKSMNTGRISRIGEKKILLSAFQIGLSVRMCDDITCWVMINEAVTEMVTMRIMKIVRKQSMFRDELDMINKLAPRVGKKPSEVLFAGNHRGRGVIIDAAYPVLRRALRRLMQGIASRRPDLFRNQADVFPVFEAAMMTGRTAKLSQLINQAFGRGTWLRLGRATTEAAFVKVVRSILRGSE